MKFVHKYNFKKKLAFLCKMWYNTKCCIVVGFDDSYALIWRVIEVVITSCTRNAVVRKGTWVRSPHSPPFFQKATQFRLCLKLCGFLVLFAILCTHFRILRPSADILHKTSIYKAYKAGKSLRQLTFFTNCAMKQEKNCWLFLENRV